MDAKNMNSKSFFYAYFGDLRGVLVEMKKPSFHSYLKVLTFYAITVKYRLKIRILSVDL